VSGKYHQVHFIKKSDFDILGIDIAPNMIELAKKTLQQNLPSWTAGILIL
jgi:ubiquinone/menaquinone biosynthesis C-methylase UbiE